MFNDDHYWVNNREKIPITDGSRKGTRGGKIEEKPAIQNAEVGERKYGGTEILSWLVIVRFQKICLNSRYVTR